MSVASRIGDFFGTKGSYERKYAQMSDEQLLDDLADMVVPDPRHYSEIDMPVHTLLSEIFRRVAEGTGTHYNLRSIARKMAELETREPNYSIGHICGALRSQFSDTGLSERYNHNHTGKWRSLNM